MNLKDLEEEVRDTIALLTVQLERATPQGRVEAAAICSLYLFEFIKRSCKHWKPTPITRERGQQLALKAMQRAMRRQAPVELEKLLNKGDLNVPKGPEMVPPPVEEPPHSTFAPRPPDSMGDGEREEGAPEPPVADPSSHNPPPRSNPKRTEASIPGASVRDDPKAEVPRGSFGRYAKKGPRKAGTVKDPKEVVNELSDTDLKARIDRIRQAREDATELIGEYMREGGSPAPLGEIGKLGSDPRFDQAFNKVCRKCHHANATIAKKCSACDDPLTLIVKP